MFETLRRLCDDAYRAQDSGMAVGLPRVDVDASQLKHLLDHYDALQAQLAEAQTKTLRDEFAIAALQGMLAANSQAGDKQLAGFAYSLADAMLAARDD